MKDFKVCAKTRLRKGGKTDRSTDFSPQSLPYR